MYASCSSRHVVRQGNVTILQSTYSQIADMALALQLILNLLIQVDLNHVTNLHRSASHSTTSRPTTWRSYRDHRSLWRHVTESVHQKQ